ncbi:serine hydrolase domain-containing protein [Ktedonobacter racemifer]|uniref:D-stereospecific aminopeptidase n=1 Tax=Ktedonobacter racemifer DSM 44963 TaxID=485913 RepID=D6TYF7_KTERA|nr:serine hydrolase domain-containing protein [Ktedonobacter racemifer]EFH83237.1 D-stereospecific aminopeptidase [Ktedonobacter racemifer DSM 44963]
MLSEIDQIVHKEIDLQGPGVAIAVVKDGKLIHSAGYGFANLEWSCPIEPDTVFRLASVTKQFTAVAIMLLEKQGKLRLDDSITTYLPDYPTHSQTITITHLLNHTSGIKSYTALDDLYQENKKDMLPGDVVAYFKDLPLEFEPGTRYTYNNSGYHLLGLIIEKITGMGYEQFIQQHIFQPLEMNRSYYMHNETIIPHRASGYERVGEIYRHAEYLSMSIPYAAGALGSTVEDLVRWDAALREERLLDTATLERMYTPTRLADGRLEEYGLGFRVTEYAGHRLIGHGGGIPGFHTFIARFVDDQAMVVALANVPETNVERITRKIARHIFELPPVERTPVTLSEVTLDKAVGAYVGENGFSLEVRRDGKRLTIQGFIADGLLPMSEQTYYISQDNEFELHFSEEQEGVFNALTLHIPIYRTFIAIRKQG